MNEVKRWKLKGFLPGVEGECKAVLKPTVVMAEDFDRVTVERDALQQRLTAADERVDVLEGLLREVSLEARHPDYDWSLETQKAIDAALKPAEGQPLTTCTWSSHEFSWSSACGMNGWEFTDGGAPAENGMHFCHSCGKTLVVEGEGDE